MPDRKPVDASGSVDRSNPRREFIRHTEGVPLEIRPLQGAELRGETSNVSFGG